MPAKIDTSFNQGFILSEENLTKIDDIIKKRFNFSGSSPNIEYELHRSDDALILYTSISEVVSEENSKRNSINKIKIKCSNVNDQLQLYFERGESTRLQLSTDDRDTALLLTADLREYLTSEVLKNDSASFFRKLDTRIGLLMVMLFFMLFLIYYSYSISNLEKNQLIAIGNNAKLEEKIDYLIKINEKRRPNIDAIGLMGFPIVLMFVVFF